MFKLKENFMKRLHIVWVMLVALLAVPEAYSVEKLTLSKAIALAMKNNNSYKISLEKVNESSLRVRETWGMLWPSLATDVSYTRQGADAGMYSSVDGQYNVNFITGNLAVNPGAFYNSLQASRKGHIIAEHDVRRIKADTTVNTIKLFYQVVLTEELIKMREESLKSLKENLKVITVGYRKGTFSRLDFLRAKVAMNNERALLINARNNFLSAKASFNIHLGREIDEPLQLDVNLSKVNFDLLQFSSEDEKSKVNNMVKMAMKNRPELIQVKLKKEVELHSADAMASVYMWPSFFVQGNWGMSKTIKGDTGSQSSGSTYTLPVPGDPNDETLMAIVNGMIEANSSIADSFTPSGWNKSWAITLGASYNWGAWSPLDSNNAKSRQMKSQAKQTDFQMDDLVRGVKLEVQHGVLKFKSATVSIESQQGNINTAEETFKASAIQFRNGIIDNTKLLEANLGRINAKTLYIQAMYNYQISRAELNRALGANYFKIK